MRITAASLASAQSRRWILAALGLILLVGILSTTLSHSKYADSLHISDTLDGTKKQLYQYYNSLRHANTKTDSHLEEEWMTVNISTSIKAAVIIETRKSGTIIPLVLHFSSVLGPDWPSKSSSVSNTSPDHAPFILSASTRDVLTQILSPTVVVYTSAENLGSFSTSAALLRHQRAGRVIVRPLADGITFPHWNSVSEFLTSPWLWEEMAPAKHVLMFQTDSILCSNSVRRVDDFFEFDLVGAPIEPDWGVGYNGGLSLRDRETTLRVLAEFSWTEKPDPYPEDQWYFARMKDLQEMDIAAGKVSSIKLPGMEIARTFAVETIDYPHPLGLQ